MYEKLKILGMAHSLGAHATARQSAIAGNIANADTPGYKTRDVNSFAQVFKSRSDAQEMRTTRAAHFEATSDALLLNTSHIVGGPDSPNGNTVSLENEMMKASHVRHQHDMALSIYSTSLNILRTSLGRGR